MLPLIKDPWEQEYRYLSTGVYNKDSFDLFSIGQDGITWTHDDINNWDPNKPWIKHYAKISFWEEHLWEILLVSWCFLVILFDLLSLPKF